MEFIVSEDLKKVRPILDQLTTGRLSNAQVEARLSCKNGTEKWMLWSIQWSKLEDSFYCVVHDINESKKIEQLKQDFANMITHDLKTPLMSTQAFLDILTAGAYGPLSENGIINVRRAKGSLSRLVDLLTQLLEIEKLSSGHVELQFSKVSVRSIVDTAIAMVESLAHEQKVDFLIEGDENVVLIADKDRIVQVMQNLLSNAIKFSPPNGKIAVAWSCDQSVLQVQVMDQGPGVEKEYQDIIFEHFRQAPQPEKTKFRSSGLGLAICKAIVEEHKGSIGFLRNEGRGSTFWFRLPLDTTIQSPSAQVKTRADVV
jgi:signal transduction histidine kinase